jgi:hypothetical protein
MDNIQDPNTQPMYPQQSYGYELIKDQNQLKDKLLEPEHEFNARTINRNLILGNISTEHLVIGRGQFSTAIKFDQMPFEEGGAYCDFIADIIREDLNFLFTASNSLEGFGRKSTTMTVNKQIYKEETNKGSLFFDKNNNKKD